AVVTTAERREWEDRNGKLQMEIAKLNAALEQETQVLAKRYQAERLAAIPEALREDVAKMLETPADKRTSVQVYLAEKFEKTLRIDREELFKIDAASKKLADATAKRIAAFEAQKPPEPKIRALWDRGEPSPTY